MPGRGRLTRIGIAAAALLIVALAVRLWQTRTETYRTFASPDGKYEVVVYRIVPMTMAFPGQAADAPGFVRLYDRSGRILQQQKVDMVQTIDQVSWEPDNVHIKLFADWPLPK